MDQEKESPDVQGLPVNRKRDRSSAGHDGESNDNSDNPKSATAFMDPTDKSGGVSNDDMKEQEDDEDDAEDWEDLKDTNVVVDEELSDFEKEDEARDEPSDQQQPGSGTAPAETVEPSYKKFGSIPFALLTKRLEQLWQRKTMKKGNKRNKKPITLQDMLLNLLPPKMLHTYSQHAPGELPESIFPLLRLLCPEKDGARRTFVKEMTLARAYIKAFGWSTDKKESRKLLNYTDPAFVGTVGAGDFSVVLQQVLSGDDPNLARVSNEPSKVTLTQINQALDDLGSLADKTSRKTNHDWRQSRDKGKKSQDKPLKIGDLRANWVRRFLNVGDLRLSPLEHKWLARILMERMQFGIGFDKLLTWYNPLGPAMWSGHNSLKAVCNALCQPAVAEKIKAAAESEKKEEDRDLTVAPYLTMSASGVQLGKNFTPMFSQRTSFQRVMTDVSGRHNEYLKNPDFGRLGARGQSSPALKSLAMKHPVFSIETKLDGERMLLHYHRNGTLVKFHSRQGIWFSNLYSPVLGPAIRRAMEEWDMDIILDGEVLAWDNAKKETVPFGNNRTVAKLRRQWMGSQGLLDERDQNVHQGEVDIREYPMKMDFANKDALFPDLAGRDCWLQFIVFDVLYVDGPRAQEFLATTVSPFLKVAPGSIISLDGLERKKILYRLIKKQVNEVEVVLTTIVRPNGKSADGESYFSFENPLKELGHPAHALDSITGAFHRHIPNLSEIDVTRRGALSDEEISQARADLINEHYSYIVENLFLEGLLFKDLSTPYVLDNISRLLSYWRKFKPDYFNGAAASDLDLVVIGAYFATGLRHSGRPSSFLCACIDSNDDNLFYPFCKVNGGSLDFNDLNAFLERTEFKAATSDSAIDYGKWFRIESIDELPPFVTTHSNVGEGKPWRPGKKDTPDLWIDPRNSAVVTLNAGEIVFSSAFPVGVTLRFPRITRLRFDKDPDEIESDTSLWDLYNKVEAERAQGANSFAPLSGDTGSKAKFKRFLTESQYSKHKRSSATRVHQKKSLSVAIAANPQHRKSNAFLGLSFCVLNGNFSLESSMKALVSTEEGWIKSASAVRSKVDVESFVKEHGGKVKISPDEECFVLGGRKNDVSVRLHIRGIESARELTKHNEKATTQKALKYRKMASHRGVLRWTFPFSLLSKWSTLSSEGTIKTVAPQLLVTNTLDYLSQPSPQHQADLLLSLGRMDNVVMMEQALEFTGELLPDGKRNKSFPWYTATLSAMEQKDIWVLFAGHGHSNNPLVVRYPTDDPLNSGRLVIYPDIFPLRAQETESSTDVWKTVLPRCEQILAIIPLIRVYGATVATQLSSSVTHLVCDLPGHVHFMFDTTNDDTDRKEAKKSILGLKRGPSLLQRLNLLHPMKVWIVSPSWVRELGRLRWGC